MKLKHHKAFSCQIIINFYKFITFKKFRYKLCMNSTKLRSGFKSFHQIPFNI
jgi:hypothetical protein